MSNVQKIIDWLTEHPNSRRGEIEKGTNLPMLAGSYLGYLTKNGTLVKTGNKGQWRYRVAGGMMADNGQEQAEFDLTKYFHSVRAARLAEARNAIGLLLEELDMWTLFNVSEEQLRKWRDDGEGPRFIRIAESTYYRIADVRDWVASLPSEGGKQCTSDSQAKLAKLSPQERAKLETIDELDLSVRTYNCLKNAQIETVGQLILYTERELLRLGNFGRKSLNEVCAILESMNLSLATCTRKIKGADSQDQSNGIADVIADTAPTRSRGSRLTTARGEDTRGCVCG